MAIVSADYLKPIRMLHGGAIPIERWKKASGTELARGCLVIASSGLIITAADGAGTGTILGVTVETADSGLTDVAICPAINTIVWEVVTATGSSGSTATITDANLFVGYGLALDSSIWYINVGDGSNIAMVLTKRLEADSTAWAKAEAIFVDSLFSKI